MDPSKEGFGHLGRRERGQAVQGTGVDSRLQGT